MTDKSKLRQQFIARRASLKGDELRSAALNAATQALVLLKDAPDPIGLYHPVLGELSPLPLAEELMAFGRSLCLPVIVGRDLPLIFRQWNLGDDLCQGYYKIAEPLTEAPQVEPKTLLVPLVAFDQKCQRLGMGAGFFDRTLHQLRGRNPKLKAYGFAYSWQQVPEISVSSHDEPLDAVITDVQIFRKS